MPLPPPDRASPEATPPLAPAGWWAALVARQRRNELALPVLGFGCAVYVVGLFTSRALISLSPLLLVLAALLNQTRARGWRAYWRNPAALVPAALYALVVVSVVITTDMAEWRHQVFRQLPLVVVPLAVAVAPPLPARYRAALAAWWLLVGTTVAAATLVHFLRHRAAIEEAISRSKTQTALTGIGHIYFGVMLALCAMYGLEIASSTSRARATGVRVAAGLAALLCAATMHLLAYRTGLVALYGALAVSVVQTLIVRRQLIVGFLMVLGLLAAPVVAYYALPSVRLRVAQTLDDLRRYQSGQDINEYSLSQRLAAWSTAGTLARQHWLVGVGQADVQLVMREQYARRSFGLRTENQIPPHNQYLQYLLGGGVLTVALLLTWLLLPTLAGPTRSDPFVRHLAATVGFALFFDSMLEVQYGLHPFVLHYAVLVVGPWQRWALARLPPVAPPESPDNLSGPAAV
ncbi:MAG: O-antigen ligase family protein [Hymenobacteraceae bacterium]|nr:O-antigen ligase family protein [Hymenobacteraceae bacterium]